jgi:F0F1-type ATP synthase delta subunit
MSPPRSRILYNTPPEQGTDVMTEVTKESHYTENVQEHLQQVQRLLEKHALVTAVAHQQEIPRAERIELVDAANRTRPTTWT